MAGGAVGGGMKPQRTPEQIAANVTAILAPKGVGIVPGSWRLDVRANLFTMRLECGQCHRQWGAVRTRWAPYSRREEFINSDYWRCPTGCNLEAARLPGGG